MDNQITDQKKQQYLKGLNDALIVHKEFEQGMSFYDLHQQNKLLIFCVKPCGITLNPKAMQAFTDIANILTLSGETISFEIVEGIA